MLAEHHVSLDFGYEGTTANYCIYLLWYLQKMVICKSTDTINKSETPPARESEDYGYHCSVRFNNQNRGLTLQFHIFSIGGLSKIL